MVLCNKIPVHAILNMLDCCSRVALDLLQCPVRLDNKNHPMISGFVMADKESFETYLIILKEGLSSTLLEKL